MKFQLKIILLAIVVVITIIVVMTESACWPCTYLDHICYHLLCATIFYMQNTCLFTYGNTASVCARGFTAAVAEADCLLSYRQ